MARKYIYLFEIRENKLLKIKEAKNKLLKFEKVKQKLLIYC